MPYQNDPSRDFKRPADRFDEMDQRRRIDAREGWGTGSIIFASLAALAVVFGLFFMMSDRNPTVATNERPAVTTTTPAAPPAARETTGSRTPGDETGRRAEPQKVPAPATPNR